jgi:TonB family protein
MQKPQKAYFTGGEEEEESMAENWKQREGHTINGEFQLKKYLGGSERSAVFLTEHPKCKPRQAAIKLITADAANAERQLAQWRQAEELSHPHLIRLLDMGRCRLDALELVFVVMEYAEENLAQVLPTRPLTPAETLDVLDPVLGVLAYLHDQGFVHSGLKPSNVMAINDQLKLASDGLRRAGELTFDSGQPSPYDPPEETSGQASSAGDMWSLGMTLAEVLTQHLPSWKQKQEEPVLPETLPAPFLDIVRGCLHLDPQRRFTIAEIARRLHPASPLPQEQKTVSSPAVSGKRRPLLAVAVAVVALAAIVAGLRVLRQQPKAQQNIFVPKAEQPASKGSQAASVSLHKPSPASSGTGTRAATASHSPADNSVVQQVLPDVPQKARDTIQGTLRVSVRLHVDPSGSVTDAEFASPGPSKYFARLAMQAAKSWKFIPNHQDDEREFLVRFDFNNTETKAFVTRELSKP